MWEESGAFKPRLDTEGLNDRPPYCIVIPPPNVTGSLHMGHAINSTIQDILIRFERMRGKDVLWQPGTDHAGIATQMVVERKLAAEGNVGRKDMSREDFVAKVWEWKEESGGTIVNQLKRLGSSCDWSRERFTMDEGLGKAVNRVFVEMYNRGLIYRDRRLVNWDTYLQTAISDLEVENKAVDGHFWHFKYLLADGATYTYVERDESGNIAFEEQRDYISIATTRPETMLGDGAVAVHPDDERYAPIVGKMVRLPLANRLIPIITDEYPDPEFGSGAVKITGAHDFNDYDVARRNNIPMYPLMGERGEMIASEIMPKKYVGMDRFKARKEVVADIDAEGLLIKVENREIQQPFGNRSGTVIEPMLTHQWFVDAKILAKEAIEAVERGHSGGAAGRGSTRFIPAGWRKTYDRWMKEVQPWCISRQLWWGHRVPAWLPAGKSEHIECLKNSASKADSSDYEEFLRIWDSFLNKPFVLNSVDCFFDVASAAFSNHNDVDSVLEISRSGEQAFRVRFRTCRNQLIFIDFMQDTDVLDTWFSSALWPFSALGWPEQTAHLEKFYPTSVLVTAFDIIFFWVARMMMQGLYFMDEVPFRDIYIHAIVRDEDGRKMSKSEGNVIDPVDLIDGIDVDSLIRKRTTGLRQPEKAPGIEKATRERYPDGFAAYGADALRFTLAAQAAAGRDIKLSVDRVAGYRNFGTKLWSACFFGQINDCQAAADFDPACVGQTLNKWIVSEVVKITAEVTRCIESYRFNDAAEAVYKLAWDTFCNHYLEMAKPTLSGEDKAQKNEIRATFAWIRDQILRLLHPLMPFITEELWIKTAERDGPLILADWPKPSDDLIDEAATADMRWLIELITSIRSIRAGMNIPPSKKAPLLMIADALDVRLETYADILSPMARVESVGTTGVSPKGALQIVVGGVNFAIPVEGLIDLDAERVRLAREIEQAQMEIDKIDNKLSNRNFMEKAPEKVVTGQRSRRERFASNMQNLRIALDNIG